MQKINYNIPVNLSSMCYWENIDCWMRNCFINALKNGGNGRISLDFCGPRSLSSSSQLFLVSKSLDSKYAQLVSMVKTQTAKFFVT